MDTKDSPLKEFLNDTGEIHAMWFGFYSAWFHLERAKLSVDLKEDIKKEYQYFTAGFFIGRSIQTILIVSAIILLLRGAI